MEMLRTKQMSTSVSVLRKNQRQPAALRILFESLRVVVWGKTWSGDGMGGELFF